MTIYPDPPPDLPDDQQAIWAQTTALLSDQPNPPRIDPNMLAAYVTAITQWREATRMINETGAVIVRGTPPNQTAAANPYITVQKDAAQTIRNLARAFGLTRQVIRVTPMSEQPPMGDHEGHLGRWCEEHGRWECKHNRSRGRGPCHAAEKLGTGGCVIHAGSNADAKYLTAIARKQRRFIPLDVTPSEGLVREVKWLAGLCTWLDGIVDAIPQADLTWGVERRMNRDHGEFPGQETLWTARLNVWVQWQQQAHRDYRAACADALKANVEERIVRLAEADGARLFGALNRGLQQMGLSEAQWELAREVMPRVLRELAA